MSKSKRLVLPSDFITIALPKKKTKKHKRGYVWDKHSAKRITPLFPNTVEGRELRFLHAVDSNIPQVIRHHIIRSMLPRWICGFEHFILNGDFSQDPFVFANIQHWFHQLLFVIPQCLVVQNKTTGQAEEFALTDQMFGISYYIKTPQRSYSWTRVFLRFHRCNDAQRNGGTIFVAVQRVELPGEHPHIMSNIVPTKTFMHHLLENVIQTQRKLSNNNRLMFFYTARIRLQQSSVLNHPILYNAGDKQLTLKRADGRTFLNGMKHTLNCTQLLITTEHSLKI